MTTTYGCCGVPWRIATILLLSCNNILNCCAAIFSLFSNDCLLKNHFFVDEVEMFMTYTFALIEAIVLLSAIISAFRKKTSMLTFATTMLLLESFFITFAAARIYYRGILRQLWHNVLKKEIEHLPFDNVKELFKSNGESVPVALLITFCFIISLILLLKISSAMVVNSYKNHTKVIRTENTFYRMRNGREYSRPASYIYETITAEEKMQRMSMYQ